MAVLSERKRIIFSINWSNGPETAYQGEKGSRIGMGRRSRRKGAEG